jgi:uncharacterized lipoprotein YbaY
VSTSAWFAIGLRVTLLVYVALFAMCSSSPAGTPAPGRSACFVPDCACAAAAVAGRALVREHWPGPDRSRALVERLAG